MDDNRWGQRDPRGHWTPNKPLKCGPLLNWPWNAKKVLLWLPDYFLPWNAAFFVIALLVWNFLTPSTDKLAQLSLDWILFIFLRNSVITLVIFGAFELHLYIRRRQRTRFKYNPAFPADRRSKTFLFSRQDMDNALRTFISGMPICTAYECMLLWCWANNIGLWVDFSSNFIGLIILALVLPLFHETHFYFTHRFLHFPPLYRWIHSVHHNAVNPSPWSSLSMHPGEHLIYWSGTLLHLIIPSHPLLLLYHFQLSATGAIVGHIGFDKVETAEHSAITTHAFAHYLHHKYFEVNYADGALPFDKWMGTWHDGTEEAQKRMERRLKVRQERRFPATKQ